MKYQITSQINLIKQSDKNYNAFITLNEQGALISAQDAHASVSHSPLAEFTLAIKDNIEVAELPTTGGTKGLAHFIPPQDAPAIAQLRKAGAIILGKTNLHELAFGYHEQQPRLRCGTQCT